MVKFRSLAVAMGAAVLTLAAPSAFAQKAPWTVPASDWGGAQPQDPDGWFGPADYPPEAASGEQHGYVTVQFDIGADGRPSNCIVTHATGYPALDKVGCRIIGKRARFAPAKDASGKPVATTGTTSFVFWKPKG
ncbi:MAG: energy transducer TonB [Pseudomonadota bacterium]